MQMLKPVSTLLVSLMLGFSAGALQLQSACYYNVTSKEHNDTDPNKKIEIASLSKILTSHWALAKLGLGFRFTTKLHITPVDDNTYDLHFEGGFDPVFSRDRLQYVIALLNNNKISQLRHITFDENFIFVDNLTMMASSDSFPHDPSSPRTKNNLTQALAKFINSYAQTRKRALDLYRVNLPETIKIKHKDLAYKSKADFQAAANERLIEIQSIPLKEILSEMNQHSNNHIADFLFQYLGSAKAYPGFVQKTLSVDLQNFEIRNGSGNPIRDPAGNKFYNSTSCAMIISVLSDVKTILGRSQLGLESIFATVGVDSDAKDRSPVSSNYSSPITDRTVVAKTGTIDPTIGLAGSILTKKGDILFAILYGTDGPKEWKQARVKILEDITTVLEKNEADQITPKDQLFLSFDHLALKKK
ncbi:MAG: D-alanyl-D-alanine carboxypeptidase [Bdellovibrio sp.]|nr:D-alanyl-D-alanine carboxypeptidase [Bdellovibrio sp.]